MVIRPTVIIAPIQPSATINAHHATIAVMNDNIGSRLNFFIIFVYFQFKTFRAVKTLEAKFNTTKNTMYSGAVSKSMNSNINAVVNHVYIIFFFMIQVLNVQLRLLLI